MGTIEANAAAQTTGDSMNPPTSKLAQAFIEQKRRRLTTLRDELLRATQAGEAEEAQIRSQRPQKAPESEDDAQKLAMLELDGTAVERSIQRLTSIERALQKIKDGTYGLSDATGAPIPRERLEAVPEATHTVSELRNPTGRR